VGDGVVDLALFQPDIPQNAGTVMRLGACLGMPVHVIEPAGFTMSDRALRRAGLDYLAHLRLVRHDDWPAFEAWRAAAERRLVLLTTQSRTNYTNLIYRKDDILLCGQESAGVPPFVRDTVDASVRIPMRAGMRALNVAVAAAMVTGEALRQTGGMPTEELPVGEQASGGEISDEQSRGDGRD